jgi:hypothetical protein
MKLETGYDLPFDVQLDAVPSPNLLRVIIYTRDDPTEENYRQLEGHVQIWVECAMFGAAGGAAVPPRVHAGPLDVTTILSGHDGMPSPRAITLEAAGLECEVAYANVLLHKLYCLAEEFLPLKSVAISLPTAVPYPERVAVVRGATSQFPDTIRPSFALDMDIDTGADSRSLTVEFQRPLPKVDFETLQTALWSWLGQGMQGGYITPPFTPERFALIATDDPELSGTTVTWDIDEVEVPAEAFQILLSMLQAFSDRFARIAAVTIE